MFILSPHLDDAVLSCWHLLAGPGQVAVVNVFDGAPPPGTPPPWWDVITGAADPVERMRERREEDRAALALVGRSATGLGLLDAQYRTGAQPAAGEIAERLEAHVPPGATVHAPAAVNPHADHVAVRGAAIELARRGRRLVLYADLPHAIRRGWPGWVSGQPEENGAAGEWHAAFANAGIAVERLVPRVRPLDAGERERKLEAVRRYRTQLTGLDGIGFAPLGDAGVLTHEVTWGVPPEILPSAGEEPLGKPLVVDARGELLDDGA